MGNEEDKPEAERDPGWGSGWGGVLQSEQGTLQVSPEEGSRSSQIKPEVSLSPPDSVNVRLRHPWWKG